MTDHIITHVRKDTSDDITHVGVKNAWVWTVQEAVTAIELGTHTFYVNCPQRADVIVRSTPQGRKYLKTTADTTTKNNLDNLPPL